MARKTVEDVRHFIIDNSRTESAISVEYRLDKNGQNNAWVYLECIDGHKYSQRWSNFRSGSGCPECHRYKLSHIYTKYSLKDIETRCNEKSFTWLNKDEFTDGTDKDHNNTYILKCKICGKTTKRNITNLFSDRQCAGCINIIKKSTKRINEELKEVYGDEFIIHGGSNGSRGISSFLHKKCGNIFKASHCNLVRQKTYCPYCVENSSIGETKIKDYLNKYKINYVPQYYFDDCRNVNPLRFDFAIFNNENNRLLFLIEYDGRQHFEPVNFGGVSDSEAFNNFEEQQNKDNIKKEYCIDNNISLLRIPHWNFDNVGQILQEWLNKYELIYSV